MRASRGVGWVLLSAGLLCVDAAAAQQAAQTATQKATQAAASAPSKAGKGVEAQAEKLYELGRSASKVENWLGAYVAQSVAYMKLQDPRIMAALGNAAFILGEYPEAIEMLSRSLSEESSVKGKVKEEATAEGKKDKAKTWAEKQRAEKERAEREQAEKERTEAEQRLAEAKRRCGMLSIHGPDGADVRVDDVSVGALPLQKTLYVLPGPHVVEIVSPAGTVRQSGEIDAGKTVDVATQAPPVDSTTLPALATPSASPLMNVAAATGKSVAPASHETKPRSVLLPLGVTLVVMAGVGAAAGGVLWGIAAETAGQGDKLFPAAKKELPVCGPLCTRLDGVRHKQDAYGNAADWAWIGAGALAAVGVTFLTISLVDSRKDSAPRMTMAPVITTRGAALSLGAAF